jgi:hypothetical protein
MKESFKRLTRKRRFRKLTLLWYNIKSMIHEHVLPPIFSLLRKYGIVHLHSIHYHGSVYGDGRDRIISYKDVITSRGRFSTSYVLRLHRDKDEEWYENKKGKRLFTLQDLFREEFHISWRAEPQEFEIHINPWTKQKVSRSHTPTTINVWVDKDHFPVTIDKGDIYKPNVNVKTYYLDFLNARVGYKYTINYSISEDEAVSLVWEQLKTHLEQKSTDINFRITGIQDDGNLKTKDSYTLTEDMICPKCHLPVFKTGRNDLPYFCMNHKSMTGAVRDKKEYDYMLDLFKRELLKYCERDI